MKNRTLIRLAAALPAILILILVGCGTARSDRDLPMAASASSGETAGSSEVSSAGSSAASGGASSAAGSAASADSQNTNGTGGDTAGTGLSAGGATAAPTASATTKPTATAKPGRTDAPTAKPGATAKPTAAPPAAGTCPICGAKLNANGKCEVYHGYSGYGYCIYDEASNTVYIVCYSCGGQWPMGTFADTFDFINRHAAACDAEHHKTYVTCSTCGKQFEEGTITLIDGLYCSTECQMASGNYCPNCGAALYVDGCHSCGWGRAPDPTEAPTPEPASQPTEAPAWSGPAGGNMDNGTIIEGSVEPGLGEGDRAEESVIP